MARTPRTTPLISGGMHSHAFVRARKISFPATSDSSSSQLPSTFSMARRVSSKKPLGRVGDVLLGGRPCPVRRLDSADPVEVGVEAPTRHRLDQVEDPLTVSQGEEERGGGTQLERVAGHENEVRGDACHLGEDETDVLGTLGHLEAHELLGGDDEGHLVGVTRHPVDTVDERRDLGVGPDLRQLLVAAMHVTDRPDRYRAPAPRRPWRSV